MAAGAVAPAKPSEVASAMVEADALALAPFELVTPGDCASRGLGFERSAAEIRRVGLDAVVAIEERRVAELEQIAGCEAGIGVFGRLLRHREAALDERAQGIIGKVGRGDGRGTLADEQPEPDLLAFGAADVL